MTASAPSPLRHHRFEEMTMWRTRRDRIGPRAKQCRRSRAGGVLLAMVVLVPLLGAVLADARPAYAAVRPIQPYTWWQGLSAGYYNLDERITIDAHTPDAPLFWAHQFGFVSSGVGYIGLQMAPGKKFARFSIWDATGASGPNCHTFGGEGVGYTCELPSYPWVVGRAYRLRVWQLFPEGTGQWWGGWVQDTVSGTDTFIGRILVPHQRLLVSSVSWTEYYGVDLSSCDQTPKAKARWEFPTADNGSVRASSGSNVLGSGSGCPTAARVAGIPSGSLQELGTRPLYTPCSGNAEVYVVTPGPDTAAVAKVVEVQNWRTDDGAPVQIWSVNPDPNNSNQRWRARCRSDGTWQLVNVNSGKCMREPAAGDGVNVVQGACGSGRDQRWWHDYRGVDGYGRDYWVLVNDQDLRCLDIEGLNYSNGVPVQVWTCYGGWNQLFWFQS